MLALLGAIAAFAAGIVHLFDLRFSTGEVYPHYSTLRSDPLGTKALYYSLQELPSLRVERNVRPLRYLGEEPSAVLKHRDDDPNPTGDPEAAAVFYLNASPYEWPFLLSEPEAVRLETLMNRGGRIILAFEPTTVPMTQKRLNATRRAQRRGEQSDDDEDKDKDQKPDKAEKPTGTTKEAPKTIPIATPAPPLSPEEKIAAREDLATRWQVDFHRTRMISDKKAGKAASPEPVPPPLEETAVPAQGSSANLGPIPWHTTVDFDLATPEAKTAGWRALYTRSKRPVIVSRPFGTAGGELILVSDPYFFSNEALRKEPQPALIATLIGPCQRIIFDETHLGIAENPGIMTLARRYHLQGTLAALVVLALLFLWKNMVSLVPPSPAGDPAGGFVPGRDSSEGFVNLLRRGVPTRDLLQTCLTQWKTANALPGGRAPSAEVAARLNAIVEAEAAQPLHRRSVVAAYHTMCAVLKRRGVGPKG